MKNQTLKILKNNSDVIVRRIERIESSLVGVDTSKTTFDEKGLFEHFKINPNYDERKSLTVSMETDSVPGLCLAVINNFNVEWVKAYGVINAQTKKPVTINTLFQAASVSKSLVATIALHLVEKNILELDEPVNNKLKNWTIPSNEFTKETEITLRHLLTHSSGINSPDGGFSREEGSKPTLIQVFKGVKPALNKPVNVEFIPGTKRQYSNLGFLIIEKLLQDVTGKETNEFAKEILFNPLGLNDSLFDYPSKEIQNRMTFSHRNDEIFEPAIGLAHNCYGCGGLVTKPSDLARFAVELIDTYQGKSNRLFSQTMAQKMLSSKIKLDPTKNFGRTDQGFGFFLYKEGNICFFDHAGGNNPGGASVLFANPKTGQGAVIMANSLTAHKRLFNSILYTLAEEYEWSIWRVNE